MSPSSFTTGECVNDLCWSISVQIGHWWNCLIDCCKLEDTTARDKFIYKLHHGLMTLQLPVFFACLLCLAALWPTDSDDSNVLCQSTAVSMLELFVGKCRGHLSTLRQSSLTSNSLSSSFRLLINFWRTNGTDFVQRSTSPSHLLTWSIGYCIHFVYNRNHT